jgi:hypothetical protein
MADTSTEVEDKIRPGIEPGTEMLPDPETDLESSDDTSPPPMDDVPPPPMDDAPPPADDAQVDTPLPPSDDEVIQTDPSEVVDDITEPLPEFTEEGEAAIPEVSEEEILEEDEEEVQTAEPETPPDTTPPSTLSNRYDIYPGRPFAEFDSPSARAFEAEDRMQPQLKLMGLICIPGMPVRWEEIEEISGKLIPGNISLAAFGNIDWPILDQKCLVLVFERPLGGRIDAFLKSPEVPEYKKIDVVRKVAEVGMLSLQGLQERNLTNRSIRSDNLFFADQEQEEIIFGEFVSSPPGFDQPVACETIERGMAGEGGRGLGNLEDDIYALGATLASLLQSQNPIRGKSNEQILLAKMATNSYQTLVGKTLLTATLLEPMRGMLNDSAEERWGFEEFEMWASGRRVTPHQGGAGRKSQRPYKFGDFEHTIPRTLAYSMSLRRDSALKLIKDGSLEQWYSRGLEDAEMAITVANTVENYAALAETVPHSDELLVSHIIMQMDPRAPISYKDINYMPDGLGVAMAIEVLRGGDIKTYAESVVNGVPGIWYEISEGSAASQFTELEFFARIAGYLQKAGPGFGIERCLYETNAGYACQSPIIAKENVFSVRMLLPTLNAVEKSVDTKKSPVDRHIAAFVAARSQDSMDRYLSELGDLDDTIQTLGMLRLLVHLQDKMSAGTLMGLTKWVGGLMGPVIKLYHSRPKRKEVEAEVPRIVRSGDLSELLTLLDDPVAKQIDETSYLAAVEEFGQAEDEIHSIEHDTGPGSEAADRTSKQAAAITSILIMIFIVSMIIMAG